jgi:dihydrofolate reductase
MRRIVVSEFMSLDGVIEDPGGAEGSKHGGWTMPYWNDEIAAFKTEEVTAADALLLGRITYEGFAAAWPGRGDDEPFAAKMNSMPKHVATTTLDALTWNASPLKGDLADAVRALDGYVLVNGSATVVNALARADLIDELRLVVYPIALGDGKRMFAEKTPLSLQSVAPTSTGALLLIYARP